MLHQELEYLGVASGAPLKHQVNLHILVILIKPPSLRDNIFSQCIHKSINVQLLSV